VSIPEDRASVNPDAPADTTSRLLDLLRERTGRPELAYATPPARLGGGFWAEIFAIRFTDPPLELSGELVLRVMPDELLARKETAVQAEVAAQGFPAPIVRLAGDAADGLGRAFMIMERAPGAPLLGGLSGPAALMQVGQLVARLPSLLGDTMARLHELDPEPVRRRLHEGGPIGAIGVTDFLDHIIDFAEAWGRADLAEAGRRLRDLLPPASPEVICHGDLHPFNLLIAAEGLTVVDWTAALLADPAYDVAFTWLLLTHAPLEAPAALRPLIRAVSRRVGRSFLRQYRRRSAHTVARASLDWHVGLHCLRTQIEVAGWEAAGNIGSKVGHPWLTNRAAFARRVSELTGVDVAKSYLAGRPTA
jgi:aminoglycoside phosphotransferase (APT) family kinase protein